MKLKHIFAAALAASTVLGTSLQAATPDNMTNAASVLTNSTDAMTALFGDPVVASGTGVQVKRSDLDQVMTGIKTTAEARGETISPEQMTALEAQMLSRLIDIQLLLQKATAADRAAGTKKATEAMATLLKKAGTQETLNMQLKAAGTTEDQLRTKVTDEATAMAALQRELGVAVTDAEVQKYYADHPDKFEVPEMVHVRHILFMTIDPTTHEPLSEDAVKAKRKQADDVLARARAGEDFAKLAQQYSDDTTTREKGGELPPFPHGQMVAEFDTAAFTLTNKQISDIVTTMYGYHIIQLLDKTPAKKLTLTDQVPNSDMTVAELIKEGLSGQKTDQSAQPYLDKLKTQANVKILDPDLSAAIESMETSARMMANTNSVPTPSQPLQK